MDPKDWAELLAKAGARYAILVTKHHDGYTLWPTEHRNLKRAGLHSERDFVSEVTEAVRAKGLKMGLYYSGGLDVQRNCDQRSFHVLGQYPAT